MIGTVRRQDRWQPHHGRARAGPAPQPERDMDRQPGRRQRPGIRARVREPDDRPLASVSRGEEDKKEKEEREEEALEKEWGRRKVIKGDRGEERQK